MKSLTFNYDKIHDLFLSFFTQIKNSQKNGETSCFVFMENSNILFLLKKENFLRFSILSKEHTFVKK